MLVMSLGLFIPSLMIGQDIAEDIPLKQVQNAQSQARFLIESFGEFLHIIAQSQDGGEVRSMISMTTRDGQRSKRLFTNEKVLIVSDIDPRVVDEESTVGEGFTEVGTYLADFDAFYDKSVPNRIQISDIYVSRIKKSRLSGDLYLRVKYRSRFEGRHKDIRKAYEQIDRMARVRIISGDQWSYYIDQITFLPPQDTTRYYEVETPDQIRKRYLEQLARAQKLWRIHEYEEALHNYRLSNQIFTADSITEKMKLIDEVIDDQNARKYYGLDGFNRIIADEPDNPDLYYERGLKFLETNKAKAASDDFHKALALSQKRYKKAWIGLADIWEKEEGVNAVEYLEEALNLDPDDAISLSRLIRIQVEAGLWTDAKRNLNKVEDIEFNEEMLLNMGLVNQNLDQYKDATESYQKLLVHNPRSAQAYFELGKSYLNLSELEQSMENFQQAISLNSSEYTADLIAGIYLNKARLYKDQSKENLAELTVDQALFLLPEMPEAKILKKSFQEESGRADTSVSEERKEGDLYFMEGNYKEALKFYRSLRKNKPGDRELTLKIGKCYYEMEDYNRSIISAQEILDLNTRDVDALLLKSSAIYKKGDADQALRLLGEVIQLNPDNREALLLKTDIHLSKEDFMAAYLSLNLWEAIQAKIGNQENLEYRKLKARALIGLEKIEEALTQIDYILQRENFNTEFLYFKAFCLYEQKDYDECISFCEASLKINEKYVDPLVLKVKVYLKKGSPQLALSTINELQAGSKDMYTISYYKSLAYFALGDNKNAKAWIDRAVKSKKDDLNAQLLNGKILLALERFLDAGMALNSAYKINPDHPEANFELGKFYHEFGDRQSEDKRFEDALPYYFKALELAPELFEAYPDLVKRLRG